MKVLSLFSGIGAFEKALENMGVNYELVNYCEIDKYASRSYSAINGVPESKNLGDITKVDTSKLPSDIDLLTYGFPCQDISTSGYMRGFEHNGERTRSGLFFEALRIIEDCQPKIAICENVKNLTGKKFAKEFQIVLESLEEAGYKNYWKVLNAKDYGVPQNRERVFIVSIREDIDKGYEFPEPFPLKLRLEDLLDDVVDEKYYISMVCDKKFVSEDISKTVRTGGRGSVDRHSWDMVKCKSTLRTRKLIPKECFRLMGFDDEDYIAAASVVSTSQLFKQAGNSIVVDVIEKIYEALFLRYWSDIK